jgi:hypothetical protein
MPLGAVRNVYETSNIHTNAPARHIIPQNVTRPSVPTTSSAPAGAIPQLPVRDLQFSEGRAQGLNPSSATTTTLAELAHLVRLQAYQETRRSQSRVKLHRCLVSSALSARLARCGELAHRTLVDHFKADDKKSFAKLYDALHDVRNSCDATRRYAILEPDLNLDFTGQDRQRQRVNNDGHDKVKSFSTWMQDVPHKTRDELLTFVAKVRSDPDFLAERIADLTVPELAALVKFHQPTFREESVLPSHRRGNTTGNTSGASTKQPPLPTPVERLLSFQRHDPLSTLLYTIFANTTGPDSSEDLRRSDIWSTVCAKLINDSKGEQFVLTVLDAWAAMREWPAKVNLELCLMSLLQDGAFLLEKNEEQSTSAGATAQRSDTKSEIRASEFYDRAVLKLFRVIDDDPSAGGIPEGVLELGSAIVAKIEDPKRRRDAEVFIMCKWFFGRFLKNAVIFPEYQGIMMGHHITEFARQKILRTVVEKAWKHVLNVFVSLCVVFHASTCLLNYPVDINIAKQHPKLSFPKSENTSKISSIGSGTHAPRMLDQSC